MIAQIGQLSDGGYWYAPQMRPAVENGEEADMPDVGMYVHLAQDGVAIVRVVDPVVIPETGVIPSDMIEGLRPRVRLGGR